MKTNAIIRIVIFSLIIIILACVLVGGIAWQRFGKSPLIHHPKTVPTVPTVGEGLSPAAVPTTVPGSLEHHQEDISHSQQHHSDSHMSTQNAAGNTRQLSIDWPAGAITIQPGDTDEILCEESGDFDDKYAMTVKTSGDKLSIQYCKDDSLLNWFLSPGNNLRKDLTVTVPRDWICHELELDVASADVDIRDMTIQEFEFDGASGECTLTNCAVGEMSLETASGDIVFSGTLDKLDCDSASAKIQLELKNSPQSIDIDSASGSLTLTLPEDCGFTVSLDALSGRFVSEFPTTARDGRHIYGDGSCKINMDSASGGVTIRKG